MSASNWLKLKDAWFWLVELEKEVASDWLKPWSVSDGAEREVDLRRKQIQSAVNTSIHTRVDHTGVALQQTIW